MTRAWLRHASFALLVAVLIGALGYLGMRLLGPHAGALSLTTRWGNFEVASPRVLLALAILPVLLFGVRYSLSDLPWQQRALAFVFRAAFLTSCVLALARVSSSEESKRVCTVFVLDVSDSLTDAAVAGARRKIAELLDATREDDEIRLITFATRPRLETLTRGDAGYVLPDVPQLRHAGQGEAARAEPGTATSGGGATDLQAALQLAYGVFPAGMLKHLAVFSDGVETEGDALAEAERARRFGVKLFTFPLTDAPPPEVAVRSLQLPAKVTIGEPFKVEAEVFSTRATKARARLYQGEMLNGLDGVRQLDLVAGSNRLSWDSVVRVGGEVTYALRLDQIEQDTFAVNNQFSTRLDVPGRPTVLYVEGQPQRASYLAGALGAQQYDVDVRAANAFPTTLAEIERYDFVVVSDVPAEAMGAGAQDLLERYVRDLGGGFLFAGGEAGYSLGGWSRTTVERLLPVKMDTERRKDIPSVALSLVIDRSGSMAGLPIEMAKAACAATVGTLQPDDFVEVIAFDGAPSRAVKMQPARYRNRIQSEIMRIQLGGGTAIFPALDAAYQDIAATQARKKHVILLTDGRAETQGIRDLVQAMLADSITVTTVGLGDGADADLLRMIAETGGGRYHAVPDPNNLPRIFTRETEMISRQAAVQDWFPVVEVGKADFLKGIAVSSAPLLHGYVATELKPPPAQLILASDIGEPILARWRVGLGSALAWTSDVKNNWAVDWLTWSGFSRFWGQLVREHMRKKSHREYAMQTSVEGGRVRAVVDAFLVDDRFDNELSSKLFIKGGNNKTPAAPIAMRKVAPGRYEADFRLDQFGSFSLRAEHYRERQDGTLDQVAVSFGQVSNPYPTEYASFEPQGERLERIAASGGGSVQPDAATLFQAGQDSLIRRLPLWPRFLYLALALFLLDLLVRRVRLFDREFSPR